MQALHNMLTLRNVLGSIETRWVVYHVGVRGVATVVDIYQRWRDDDWDV